MESPSKVLDELMTPVVKFNAVGARETTPAARWVFSFLPKETTKLLRYAVSRQ